MRLGSFTLDGTTINVDTGFDQVIGLIYRFVRADNGHQVAVTTHKGMDITAGVEFGKADLQRGLDSVRKPLRRLPPGRRVWGAAAHLDREHCVSRRRPVRVRGVPDGSRVVALFG